MTFKNVCHIWGGVEEARSFYRKVIIHRVKQCCAVLFIALLFNIKPDIVK